MTAQSAPRVGGEVFARPAQVNQRRYEPIDTPARRAVAAARTALWNGLRLAVLDTETCSAADGDHVLDLAVVTCRAARSSAPGSGTSTPA